MTVVLRRNYATHPGNPWDWFVLNDDGSPGETGPRFQFEHEARANAAENYPNADIVLESEIGL